MKIAWPGIVVGGSIFTSVLMSAGQGAEPVASVIQRMDERDRPGWAFVRTVENNGQTEVARHDPRRANTRHGWTLESIDGRSPTEQELEDFHQRVDQAHQLGQDANAPTRVATLVNLDSLALVSTDERGRALYSFAPRLGDMPAKHRDVMAGTLVYHPAENLIESLSISNTRPYAPRFAVKMKTFDLHMTFALADGHIVPTGLITHLQGKAFLKAFDRELRVEFSEYEWTRTLKDPAPLRTSTPAGPGNGQPVGSARSND